MGLCTSIPQTDHSPVTLRPPTQLSSTTATTPYNKSQRLQPRNNNIRKGYESNHMIRPVRSSSNNNNNNNRMEQTTNITDTNISNSNIQTDAAHVFNIPSIQHSTDVDVTLRSYPHTTRHNRHRTAEPYELHHLHHSQQLHNTDTAILNTSDSYVDDSIKNITQSKHQPQTTRGTMPYNNNNNSTDTSQSGVFNYATHRPSYQKPAVHEPSHDYTPYNHIYYNNQPSIVVRSAELRPIIQQYNNQKNNINDIQNNTDIMITHDTFLPLQRSQSCDIVPNTVLELTSTNSAPHIQSSSLDTNNHLQSTHNTPLKSPLSSNSNNSNSIIQHDIHNTIDHTSLHSKSTPDVLLLDKLIHHDHTLHHHGKPMVCDDSAVVLNDITNNIRPIIRHRRTRSDIDHDTIHHHHHTVLPSSFHQHDVSFSESDSNN